MAEGKSITRFIRAVFDRASAKKMESEFEGSLKSAGEKGGDAAGKGFLRELKAEFDKKKAKLAEQLAAGTISEKEFRKQSDIAGRAFNIGLLKNIDAARRRGELTDREYVKLARTLKRVGDEGGKSMDRLNAGLKGLAAGFAAVFGVRAIGRFIGETRRAFDDLRTGQRQLEQQLHNTGTAWADVTDEVRATARALWDTHRLTEGEVNQTLRQLVNVTGDYQTSLRSVGLAHDIMAATGLGAEQAARLLGRAINGDLNAFSRYGIQLAENRDVIEQLTERFEGNAAAALSNSEVRAKAMGDLREMIGGLLTASLSLDEATDAATETIRKLTDALGENSAEITRQGRNVVALGKTIVHSFWIVVQSIGSGVSAAIGGLMKMSNVAVRVLNGFIDQMNRLPGVNIDFRIAEWPADRFLDEMRAANDRVTSSVAAIGDAWRDVGREAEAAGRRMPKGVTDGGEDTGGKTGRDRAAEAAERERLRREALIASYERDIEVQGRRAAATLEGEAAVEALNRQLHIENALLASGAEKGTEFYEVIEHLAGAQYDAAEAARLAAESMEDSYGDASQAIRQDLAALGEAASAVFQAIAIGGIQGLQRLAKAKVLENIAWAIERTAQALGGVNPAAALAAKKHMVAAAKWGAVGGAAAAIGGGGGSSVPAGRSLDTSQAQRAQAQPPDVHVYLDPLSPSDPRMVRVVMGATATGTRYFGPAPNVTVKPYPQGGR